jgi:hypothetical protein
MERENCLKVLLYSPAEMISIREAAARAGRSERTVRNWCLDRQIGRRIGKQWAVSAPALDMFLANDEAGLQAYLAGDRTSERVASYFRARSIPLPSIGVA